MSINSKVFKAYDIRGIYPSEINEELAYQLGRAVVKFSQAKEVVVGRDMRLSSPSLSQALQKGIVDSGAQVLDIGLASTPTFYFAVRHLKALAGVQVSASHNPKEYNGFKIVLRDEKGIVKIGLESGLEEIREMVLEGENEFKQGSERKEGEVKEIKEIEKLEIEEALSLVPLPAEIPSFRVVADPANAMGALYLDALFARFPQIELIRMNFELDGRFPAHEPNPLIFETLEPLQKRVVEEKADFGLAPDGDGDRIFFINEKGEAIPASHLTALISYELLKERTGEKIFYDVRYVMTPREVIKENGGIPQVSRVGHALISQAMREKEAIFAGESSGHYFFRQTGYAEAPLLVILYLLRILAREKKPFSEVIAPLARSFESGEINFRLETREKLEDIFKTLEKKYQEGETVKIDGLAIEFSQWRFSLRASNTEPLLRLNIEGKTREIVEEKKEELITFLRSFQ
jgi:phosphomannomutase